MNHPGIDPSLRAAERPPDTLADGFSPSPEPAADARQEPQEPPAPREDLALMPKSPF